MVDYNATDTTEDGQRKQVHSENEITSPSLMGSNKDQGEVGTGNSPKGVSGKRKRGRNATKHKKQNNQTKASTQRKSVAIEVLLHPCQQKSLLLLLKSINLKEEAQASQAFIFFILFIIAIFFLKIFRDKK